MRTIRQSLEIVTVALMLGLTLAPAAAVGQPTGQPSRFGVEPVPVYPEPELYMQPYYGREWSGPGPRLTPPGVDWRHPLSGRRGIRRSEYGRAWRPYRPGRADVRFRGDSSSGYWNHLSPETFTPGYFLDPRYRRGYRLYRFRTPRLGDWSAPRGF